MLLHAHAGNGSAAAGVVLRPTTRWQSIFSLCSKRQMWRWKKEGRLRGRDGGEMGGWWWGGGAALNSVTVST